jgi:hypothetical protein
MAQVEMLAHWANWNGEGDDLAPGQKLDMPDDVARQAVANGTAKYASLKAEAEAEAAG